MLPKQVEGAVANELRPELPVVVPDDSLSLALQAAKGLQAIEDRLLAQAMEVTTRAMQFGDISPKLTKPPHEWLEEMGKEEAWRKFRYIKAGQMPASMAPAGVKVAVAVTMGVLKSRAIKQGPRLAINVVQLTEEPMRTYPTQVIDE